MCIWKRVFILAVATVGLSAPASSQMRAEGPIINGFGGVYTVDDVDFPTRTDRSYRVVFEVSMGAGSSDSINAGINTVARFLNMHAQAGVPLDSMDLALVLHGSAGKDALDNASYRKRFGVNNPNLPLLNALHGAGVKVFLCGQTATYRGLAKNELSSHVQLALSAMTVLVTLQAEGYALIAF